MKRTRLLILFTFIATTTLGQAIITNEPFTKIKINNSGKIRLKQGSTCQVSYDDKDVDQSNSVVSVNNGMLNISGADNDLLISLPKLEQISIEGKGKVISLDTFNVDVVNLYIGGDGNIELKVKANDVNAKLSGFGKITLSGRANSAEYSIPGSGKIDASALTVKKCDISISGLGKCMVDVSDEMNVKISGNGTVLYKDRPLNVTEDISGSGVVKKNDDSNSFSISTPDTTRFMLGGNQVWVMGPKEIIHKKKHSIKPIWGGFEMGINSYMDNGGTFTLSPEKKNFELKVEKSIYVALNIVQGNLQIGNSNAWLFTGLGITWNNYRFEDDVILQNGDYIHAIIDTSVSTNHIKSKLTTSYITAPLMIEVFTSRNIKNAFHIGAGGIFGFRIETHTKRKFEIDDTVTKTHSYDDFNLSPFRYGFRVALGYGKFNIFGDYYASTLFKDKKGPVLFPVDMGITFIGF